MIGINTSNFSMTFPGFVSSAMKIVKTIQKHAVKNLMFIYSYVFQKLRNASNIFVLNNYSS